MSVRPGTRLDGRYRLSDRLAYGGMGEVWRASDEVLSREVAVKILRPELAEDEAFVRRFRAEARTTSGLPHNGIAAVYDYGETRVGADGQSPAPYDDPDADPVAYLVMELVPGEALSSILSRDGALGPELTLDLVAQAARALHAAHLKGVIHRDIKPANLMVTPEGRVKVTDFGIARPLDHEPLTATGQVMGTAHYLAPELAKGQDASPLSDVYALGVVAYECLAGHRPFEGDNQVAVALAHLNEEPPPLPGTIPAQVRAVVGSAMAKEPQRRMPSAEAFAAALETLRYRQATDDHMTPGTGIIPGSPAHEGLSAAGVYGTTQDRGWTPGGQDGSYGAAMAQSPVPAAAPPRTGAHGYGPATSGQARAGVTGGLAAAQGTAAGAGVDRGQPSAYGPSGGQGDYADYGYGGARSGGGYGGGYGGPPDPFRTPTAPGGITVTPGRRERPQRSLSGPLLLAGGLGTLLLIVLLIWYFASSDTGSQDLPERQAPTTPPVATAPVSPTASITSRPSPSSRSHSNHSSSTSSSSKSSSKSSSTTSSPPLTGPPSSSTSTSDSTSTSTSDSTSTSTTTTTTTTTTSSTAKGSTAPSSNPSTSTSNPVAVGGGPTGPTVPTGPFPGP